MEDNEELEKEREIEEAIKKAEEWAIKEEEERIKFEERKEKKILEAMKKAEESVIEEEKKKLRKKE